VESFAIAYKRSGGLKPSGRALTVRAGRRAAAARSEPDGMVGHYLSTHFRIGFRPVKRLRAALERADFQAIAQPGPSTCADCYSYDMRYRGRELIFGDSTLPETLRPVVARLEALIEAHLPLH
jgi:hypothetical protein